MVSGAAAHQAREGDQSKFSVGSLANGSMWWFRVEERVGSRVAESRVRRRSVSLMGLCDEEKSVLA